MAYQRLHHLERNRLDAPTEALGVLDNEVVHEQRDSTTRHPAAASGSARDDPADIVTRRQNVRQGASRAHRQGAARDERIVAGPRGAAVRLGLKRTTLLSKMAKLGISPSLRRRNAFRASRPGRSRSDQPATATPIAWPIAAAADPSKS
jgi:hypothetical protein